MERPGDEWPQTPRSAWPETSLHRSPRQESRARRPGARQTGPGEGACVGWEAAGAGASTERDQFFFFFKIVELDREASGRKHWLHF